MKRVLKAVALVFTLLILAAAVGVGVVFMGRPSIPDGLKIGSVELVKDGFVAAFIVDAGNDAVLLVDAGNDEKAQAILAALKKRGLDADAVKAIFLTHGDGDHTHGAKAFPKATVMALEADVELAEGRKVRMPIGSPKPTGFKVGRVLKDGEVVEVGDTKVEVFAIPGHTPGSAAFLAQGVLLLGDSAETSSDGKLEACSRLFCTDRALNVRSLKELAGRLAPRSAEVKAIAVAHSGVLQRGLAPLTALAAQQ
jgi:glyoxylase-like metal-dependent hydrolase (beta-lactamase superfamily II)